MNKLEKSILEKPESDLDNAWKLVKNGMKLLEASSILMHLINTTMKNYSVIASNFATYGKPILSLESLENRNISLSDIIAFLELSKKVAGSFSAITLTIVDAVGEACSISESFSRPSGTVSLLLLEAKFNKIFHNLSRYKNNIPSHSYLTILDSLTTMLEQHSRNLEAGRNTVRVAEEILGAVLRAQRALESTILSRS